MHGDGSTGRLIWWISVIIIINIIITTHIIQIGLELKQKKANFFNLLCIIPCTLGQNPIFKKNLHWKFKSWLKFSKHFHNIFLVTLLKNQLFGCTLIQNGINRLNTFWDASIFQFSWNYLEGSCYRPTVKLSAPPYHVSLFMGLSRRFLLSADC